MRSIIYQTASQLAQAIQKKEVTSKEVVQAHLAHIKKHNAKLNAIVILMEEEALKRAKEADNALAQGKIWGPLHGVPITVKEAFNIRGLKTTVNFKPLHNNVAKQDALVVTRLKNAGAVILGKTNIPTLLADYQTNGPIYGRSNNPYNLDYTPGGSTGGGAAAVAAGLSPLAFGSDIGGSVRVPAHFCGLYGLKPTENVLPWRGHVPPLPGTKGGVLCMCNFGPLARSLEDINLAFDIIQGPDYRDVKVAPIQWKQPSGKTLSDYMLAWSDTFGQYKAGKETCSLLQEFVQKISIQGGNISKNNPPDFDFEKAEEIWGNIFGYIIGQDTPLPIRFLMKMQWKFTYRGAASKGYIKGLGLNFVHYARAIKQREALIAQLQAFFDEYDFWLCPVAMSPAFTHRKPGKDIEIDGQKVDYLPAGGAFTRIFNTTGHPVFVIPLGQSREELPIGLQIVGPYWSEPELFHFAKQLSKLTQGFIAPKGYMKEPTE